MPAEATDVLVDAGHDAVSTLDQNLGGALDSVLADVCQREQRALLTLDLDFADIRAYRPADYHGIVVLRLSRLDKRRVLSALRRLSSVLDAQPLVGSLWIVDENRVRIRR